MLLSIDDTLRSLFMQIVTENNTEEEWAEIESDDMFQLESYVGGYDADERAFCFSYYHQNGSEYWFQVSLDQIKGVLNGKELHIDLVEADL